MVGIKIEESPVKTSPEGIHSPQRHSLKKYV